MGPGSYTQLDAFHDADHRGRQLMRNGINVALESKSFRENRLKLGHGYSGLCVDGCQREGDHYQRKLDFSRDQKPTRYSLPASSS